MDPVPGDVVTRPEQARHLFHPLRARLLRELAEPASAPQLARRLGLPRQRLGYHLRLLERDGLLELVETRRRRNCEERVLRARAREYLVSPAFAPRQTADAGAPKDRFSWWRLAALAARAVRDLAELRRAAAPGGARLQTLAAEVEIRFASIGHQVAFAQELTDALERLRRKYHRAGAPDGREVRVICGAYPSPPGAASDD